MARTTRRQRDAARRQLRDVADLVADLARAVLDDDELTAAAEQIGYRIKLRSYDVAAYDLGPDLRMRNVGRNGLRVGISYGVTGPGQVYLNYKPTAMWAWLEEGVKRHDIPRARKSRRGRDPKSVFVKAAGYPHPVRGPIKHPGVKPRRTFTAAVTASDRIPLQVLTERVETTGRTLGFA